MSIYLITLHIHSFLRWLLLIFLVYSVFLASFKWQRSGTFTSTNYRIISGTVYFAHLQLLMGIILYFLSPKVMFTPDTMSSTILRFFTLEHSTMMIIAIACLTIGNASAKKATDSMIKPKRIAVWYGIAFVIILISIPWPFRNLGSGWI